jgi:outer membrane protein
MLAVPFTLLLSMSAVQEPSGATPTPRMLTMREALALAAERNLSLARARADVPAADAQRRAALSFVLPYVELGASLVRNSTQVSFGPPEDVRTILPKVNWNTTFSVTQPIFAGLRERKGYQQAKVRVDIAREGLRQTSDDVLLLTSGQFLTALEAEALIDVEKKNLELAERRRKQATDLFEAGETTRVDVLRAEVDIKAAERRVVEAERQREVAVSSLRVALALDEDVALVEPDTEASRAIPPVPPGDELLRRAYGARPEVRQAEYSVQDAKLEVEKQRGAYFPVISADAAFINQKTTFPKNTYGYGALRFTVPIYQGGEVGAQVAFARQRQQQAELALEETRRNVREDVRLALFDLDATRTNLSLAEEQLQASQAEYDQIFEQYRSQELTSLDLQASEAALADARRAVATGRLLVYAAEVRVWYAAGALSEVALNQESKP